MSKVYTTIQGDMWDAIARKTLGNEYLMHALIDANPMHIDTVIFPANVQLVIPAVEQAESENLPPWKRE